ncbi:hypothetical protein FTO74_13825 [Granulicella sp. WH15]|uniref:MATE family efflux transporter n=1 Tax=Granulicella sp. WH15 TaxID=2602070 RepID=UPI0013677A44|nr:MATE family efflux transporter [Granulicella sp. WH15]QHN04320.1 hypothetical protein FTO74_13825 [Granulicella sp. WH15]
MRSLRWTVAKNALSNIVRGGATAIVAVALPHFLVHSLDRDRFAAWSLILQIAAYASFLDFGLQTAIARFVAQALELGKHEHVRKLIETAFAMLSIAALISLALLLLIVFHAGIFFYGVPSSILHEFQVAALIMALGAVLLLPLSTFTGVLIGMHQNEFTAYAVGGSRLIGATIAIIASHYTRSLITIALCVAVPNLLGGLLQMYIVGQRLASARLERLAIDRNAAVGFLHYCAGLTVWAFGMLLVSGLDITIVGHYQFESAGYYAVAATLTSIFASANSSILSALLAPFAAMQARGRLDQMRVIVIHATRINTFMNVAVTAIVIAYGKMLLGLWVGEIYAKQAYPVLVVLMATQTLRLFASGYSIALIATGYQNSGIFPVLIEAVVNLVMSLYLVQRRGALGVAYGSFIGAVVAIPALFVFCVGIKEGLNISRFDLGFRGILVGMLPVLPAFACAILVIRLHQFRLLPIVGWLVSIVIGFFVFKLTQRQWSTATLAAR